jgi:hypothetical protein
MFWRSCKTEPVSGRTPCPAVPGRCASTSRKCENFRSVFGFLMSKSRCISPTGARAGAAWRIAPKFCACAECCGSAQGHPF